MRRNAADSVPCVPNIRNPERCSHATRCEPSDRVVWRFAVGAQWAGETMAAKVLPIVERLVRTDLEPFLAAMQRRARRDRDRDHAYHDDLRRAAFTKLAGLVLVAG